MVLEPSLWVLRGSWLPLEDWSLARAPFPSFHLVETVRMKCCTEGAWAQLARGCGARSTQDCSQGLQAPNVSPSCRPL